MATDNMEKYRLSMGAAEIDQALQKAKDLPPGGVAKDTVIDESTKESTNVPTTKAVYDFVEAEKPQSELIYTLEYSGWNMNEMIEIYNSDVTQEAMKKIAEECTKVVLYWKNDMGQEEQLIIPLSRKQNLTATNGWLHFAGLFATSYVEDSEAKLIGGSLDMLYDLTAEGGAFVSTCYTSIGADLANFSATGFGSKNEIIKAEFWKDSPGAGGGGADWNGGTVTGDVTFASNVDFRNAEITGLDTGDTLLQSVDLTATLQTGATMTGTFSLTKSQRIAMEDKVKYLVYKPNDQDRMVFPLLSTNHETPDQTVNMVFGAVQYTAGAGAMYKEIAFGPAAMFSVSGETGIAIACEGLGNATMAFFALAQGGTIEFWGSGGGAA